MIIFIVYNDYSNRNLAKLVSELFDKNEIDIYFEIDEIIVNSNFPKDELDETIRLFKKNNYYEWVENE